LLQKPPNDAQPPPDGRLGAALLVGDLGVGVALQLPHRDLAQRRVAQAPQQCLDLIGQHGGLLRRRTVVLHLVEAARPAVALGRAQGRAAAHLAAAALVALVVLDDVGRLAGGEDHQQGPQAVAVLQVGELALFGPAAEGVEGAEGRVLLVGDAARGSVQLRPRQGDQARVVALPQQSHGFVVAALKALEESGDRPGN
jgi:hypothetical protein